MAGRFCQLPVLAIALFLVLPARGQEKPKDASQDAPLPKGAKLRLGGNGLRFRFNPSICLLPPDYKTVLVPTVTDGVREFDVATGQPTGKGDDTSAGMIVVSGDGKRCVNVRSGFVSVKEVATNKKSTNSKCRATSRPATPPPPRRSLFRETAARRKAAIEERDGRGLRLGHGEGRKPLPGGIATRRTTDSSSIAGWQVPRDAEVSAHVCRAWREG